MITPPSPDDHDPRGRTAADGGQRLEAPGSAAAHARGSTAAGTAVGVEDRLLVTALAAMAGPDGHAGAPAGSPSPQVMAIADPTARVVEWARRHPAAADVRAWLSRLRRARTTVFAIAAVAALAAGWIAAQAALGLDRARPTNVYWLLGGVLLPQTLLLLAWLAITLFGGVGALGVTIGGLLRSAVARLLAGRLGPQPAGAAALGALARMGSEGPVARWSIGLATNLLWTSFNIGVLAAVLALLAVQQHTFCWESTIFSAEGYRRITAVVAEVPSALGFATPDADQIATARLDPSNSGGFSGQDEAGRVAWSGLLVGSVVAYGLLPRAMLAMGSGLALARALRRGRLDLDSPLLAPIAAGLSMSARRGEFAPAAAWPTDARGGAALDASTERAGPVAESARPAIVAIELAVPACGWPPAPLTGVEVVDLGRLEGREDRRTAVTALAALAPPRSLTVFASLTTTPDRGVSSLLRELGAAARRPPAVVLTGGSALRARGDSARVAQRAADWHAMALEAGVPADRLREIDLDSLTAASAAALRAFVTDGEPSSFDRRIERAARLIADAADRWIDQAGPPSIGSQADLHRAIAELYGAARDGSPWTRLLGTKATELAALAKSGAAGSQEIAAALGRAGERFTAILPPALRMRPKWIAAGALAGALGCVAAAFVGPAAIAIPVAVQALPIWSGLGAAVGGIFSAGRAAPTQSREPAGEVGVDDGWATAIRAATIQALVLELQGGGEARLAMVLERSLPEPDPEEALLARRGHGAARRWLDGVRHRFDLALQQAPRLAEAGT